MAWTAKIMSVTPNDANVTAQVTYYDAADTGFTTPLASKVFTFPSGTTAGQASALIVKSGQDLRTQYNATNAFVGTTINVP